MSAYAKPMLVEHDGSANSLERLPLSFGNDGQFSEKWLQETLFKNPHCLPVHEIDPHVGPLIPICMELETGAGPADILFLTSTGQVIIVETKLWRNPEARREVVAQILDYAKQLAAWTYEDLAREASIASKGGAMHILNQLKNFDANADQAVFVDGINRSLKAGDFLLLIVGDGIRSGAEALVGFLERYGNLRFGLGLIEIAAFRLPNQKILLHPRILAKTEILQRTVFIGPAGPVTFEVAASVEDAEQKPSSQGPWFQSFWSGYLDHLALDDPRQPKPATPAKSTNMYLPMPPSGAMAWVSAYIAQSSSRGGVYLTFSKRFDKAPEYFDCLQAESEEIERTVGVRLVWEKGADKFFISSPTVVFKDLNSEEDRNRVQIYLADMTNRFVNAFRHRLEALSH